MAKYQAGDRAMFAGKVVKLEDHGHVRGGETLLMAREEATGRLLGSAREYHLSPIRPVPPIPIPPLPPIIGVDKATRPDYSAAVKLQAKDPGAVAKALDGLYRISQVRDFLPISTGYNEGARRVIADTIRASLPPGSEPEVKVTESRGAFTVDLEFRTSGPTMDHAAIQAMIRERLSKALDTYLLAGPGSWAYDPLPSPSDYMFKIGGPKLGSIGIAPIYGSIDPGPAHRCPKCNGPAKPPYVGFFEAEPAKCLRHGGCLAEIAPEVKRGSSHPANRGESIWFARGGGLSVRHPLQDVAVAIWREVILDRAFGRKSRPALTHSIVV